MKKTINSLEKFKFYYEDYNTNRFVKSKRKLIKSFLLVQSY